MPHSVQMTKLISRKINFLQFKPSDHQNNFVNNIPNALLGNGGFLIPKMYQLTMQPEKKIDNPQNIMEKIISRKNISKNIYPF